MAVIEEGGGPRTYRPLPHQKPKQAKPPRDTSGSGGYQPLVAPQRAPYDQDRITPLTRYAIPSTPQKDMTARAVQSTPRTGDAQTQLHGFTLAAGGLTPDPSKPHAEPKPAKPGDNKPSARRTYQLTWDEYNKLSDEQRAAVDFNTILVEAREKDLNAEYNAPEKKQERYFEDVEEMFGEGRGTETYAPELMGVLSDMDFKGDGETDFDDLLNLDTAVSMKQLKNFSFDREVRPPQVPDSPEVTRLRQMISPGGAGGLAPDQRAAVYTRNVQEAMAKAGEVLQSWRMTAARSRMQEVLRYGGDPTKLRKARGYGDYVFTDADGDGYDDEFTFDEVAQDSLGALTNRKYDPAGTVDFIAGLSAKDQQDILRYIDEQTKVASEFGIYPLGTEPTTRGKGKNKTTEKLNRPRAVRRSVGLSTGGDNGRR